MAFGFGFDQQVYTVNFIYNLETGRLSNYIHGAFELGLSLKLFKEDK